jgi:hypothetical protein
MGHTIPPKRNIIYSKLDELKRFANTLRQPYRDNFLELINSVYPNISSIVYTNSLEDEEMIIYAMLVRLPLKVENKEKILKCLSILLTH